MNIKTTFRKDGRPVFGTIWQRLWWALGGLSRERRETTHYNVYIYYRVRHGSLESFSLAYRKSDGQLV